jgi:hypothetical protein
MMSSYLDSATMIEGAGFRFDRLETAYRPGLKPWSFIYEGSAKAR